MSIVTTISTLQTKHAAISGVTSAPTAMPVSLNDVTLPIILTFPGPATWDTQAVGLPRQDRIYLIRAYVMPVAQGKGVDEGFQAVLPILQALGEAYLDDIGIAVDSNIDHVSDIADNGHQIMSFASIDYHGFEMRITVTEKG